VAEAGRVRNTTVVSLDPVRRLTAERMLQSHLETAPVTVLAEADATQLVALRHALNSRRRGSPDSHISFTPFFVKIVADALVTHPEMNARLNGKELLLLGEINVNVALALPDGNLIAPVIRNAHELSLLEINDQITDLVSRAGRKKLKPSDMRGGTFTVSNGGMFPAIRWNTPILNLPQCAILGTGAITLMPVVRNDEIVIRSVLALSLSFDHRVVNGYPASGFLQTLVDMIADPGHLNTGE